jgi:diguanylate cyclase (GGDEF)-like protein
MLRYLGADLSSSTGRALIEERYRSLRQQVPIIYLLGLVNLSAMELAATGRLVPGANLPTLILGCGLIRLCQWFGHGRDVGHGTMVARMAQTVLFATLVCVAVCVRCLYLLQVGDSASHMAVMLFGGLTAIGVAYGLTALPPAGRIPLLLIIGPLSVAALLSKEPQFAGAAFGLVVVGALTMRLLIAHNRHFTDVIKSRAIIAREQRRVANAHEEALIAATTDFLTGLPNRRAFVSALEAAASDSPGTFSLAIIDLNRFKAVNDTFGHAAGDELLQEVAARLVAAIGDRGLVARLGGDEFGVLIEDVHRLKDVAAAGAAIISGVNGSAMIRGRELGISVSCGLRMSDKSQDQSPSRLMADADLALYQAKVNPGGGATIFEPRMEGPRRRRAQVERALRAPDLSEHLSLVFQPIVDLGTGRILAHEALARWTDPELGPVPPSEFVPLAEQLNLIDEISPRLMDMAFEAAKEWPEEVRLSFNLSAIQICSPGSAKSVLRALRAARLSPSRLQVEVTETALLADFTQARDNLTQLRAAGATIVLDDFGAGFASIGYLRQLHFDQIKLDGGLVTAAHGSADGKRLLRAVIGLCEILGVSSVAEHVENQEILTLVLELGCAAGQGFWLQEPLGRLEVRNLHEALAGGRSRSTDRRAA